jgi:hypothetical protein
MEERRVFYWLGFRLLVMFLLLMPLHSQGPEIVFFGRPETVEIGDPVVLSWEVPEGAGVDAVFITGIGRVEREGQLRVTPLNRTTTYTLLGEGAAGLRVAQVTIEVRGGRGDVFPQREEFKNGRDYKIAAPGLVHLLDSFHRVLQHSMGFEVEERYHRRKRRTVFVTKTSSLPGLVKRDEKGVRSRRLAYWVEVSDSRSTAGTYDCEIRTLIQYQRRKESRWRPGTGAGLHRQWADTLYRKIGKSR